MCTEGDMLPSSSGSEPCEEKLDFDLEIGLGTVPVCVFRPTHNQIENFPRLIQMIENAGAHLRSGICKLIPPEGWNPRPSKKDFRNIDSYVINNPVWETIERRHDGAYVKEVSTYRKNITVKEYRQLANSAAYKNKHPELCRDEMDELFWRDILEGTPIYGADTEGSLYDSDVKHLNMAHLNTILDDINGAATIHGVNTVYLYFGMYKTMFAWHVEDMDLYSINYLHDGAPKHWYAVSSECSERLERLLAQQFPDDFRRCRAFIRHKNFVLTPELLRQYDIPFGTMTQRKNEFIITFPKGYHMGYNTGYNIAESTNFASERWVDFGKNAMVCRCRSDSVEIDMRHFMSTYRAEEYSKWYHYWYSPSCRFAGSQPSNTKRASSITASTAPTDLDALSKKTKRDYEGLWSRQTLDLFREKQWNSQRALLSPHCAVCQFFQRDDLATRTKTVPTSSRRLTRNSCFAKSGAGVKKAEGECDKEEDILVACHNCHVVVHPSCYAALSHPEGSSSSAESSTWLCARCRQREAVRVRSTSCHLCEMRGGALIQAKTGSDSTFVHVGCAIFNRRTYFADPAVRLVALSQSPPKHGSAQHDHFRSRIDHEYYDRLGKDHETALYQCIICRQLREGLLKCIGCDIEGRQEATLVHVTCARAAGLQLELRNFPEVAVFFCPFHDIPEDDVEVDEKVRILGGSRQETATVLGAAGEQTCVVDFTDGTTSDNTLLSDIVSCECAPKCQGRLTGHSSGSRVRVSWPNDGLVYDAYFRRAHRPEKYLVRLMNGKDVEVASRDVCRQPNPCPTKKSKSR